jgi:hypothetical protein
MYGKLENEAGNSLRVACILDDSAFEWFQYECTLIPLGLDTWKDILQMEKPDMLLVQSAWEGNYGEWRYKISNLQKKSDRTLLELVNWCKENSIPTVFWNKEDPYHLNTFYFAAKHFDYIFTTDSSCVEKYKRLVKHNNVYVLPFGVQPRIHNPID